MAFISGVIGAQDANGDRIDLPGSDGTRQPFVVQVGEGILPTWTNDGSTPVLGLALDPEFIAAAAEGAGAAVATIAALRAIPAADRQNGQTRTVIADADGRPFTAILKTTGGTGLADDGVDVFIPSDKVIGDPDRWYRDPILATDSLAGRLTAPEKIRVRQGYGGTLRARAKNTAQIADLNACPVAQDGIELVAGDRFFLEGQTPPNNNGLYVVGTVGVGTAPLTRAPEMAVGNTILYGLRVSIAAGTSGAGTIWEFYSGTSAVVGTNQLDWRQMPDAADRERLATLFQFSGVPVLPGTNKAAEIQAVLDDGNIPLLQPGGIYEVEAPIDVDETSGQGIVCPTGIATLLATYAPDVSQADVATNAILRIRGTIVPTTLDTILTNAITDGGVNWYGAGTRKVSLASVGTLAANGWFAIEGHETGVGESPGGTHGVNVECTELCKVQSISGLKTTLWRPTIQHHVTTNGGVGLALSVKAVTPVEGFRLEGVRFDARGGSVANGVLVDYAVGIQIARCAFAGFSRAAINVRKGTQESSVEDCTVEGECNSGLFFESAMNIAVTNLVVGSANAARHHANGTIRAGIMVRGMSRNVNVDGFAISHVCQGIALEAFRSVRVANGYIDDIDIRDKMAQDSEEHVGIGINTGAIDLSWANWSNGMSLSNVMVSNCRVDPAVGTSGGGAVPLTSSVYIHDVYGCNIVNMLIENDGLSPYATIDGDDDYLMPGLAVQDASGMVQNVTVKGCEYGLAYNSSQGIIFDGLDIAAAPGGSGANPVFGLWLNQTTSTLGVIRNARIQGGVYFGPDFVPEWNGFYLHDVTWDDTRYSGTLLLAKNTTGAVQAGGNVGVIDTTAADGTREIDLPTSASDRRVCVWAMPALTTAAIGGYGFVVVDGEAPVSCDVGALEVLDKLSPQAGSAKAVCLDSSAMTYFARVLTTKGAGASVVRAMLSCGELPFVSTAGAINIAMPTVPGTGTNDGASARIAAQDGQAQTGGSANNDAGSLYLDFGVPGTGGGGAAGATGVLAVREGNASPTSRWEFRPGASNLHALTTCNLTGAGYIDIAPTGHLYLDSGAASNIYLRPAQGNGVVVSTTTVDSYLPIQADTISEHTAASGVTIDGFKIKDNGPDLDKWRSHELSRDVADVGGVVAETIITAPHQACTVISCRFTNDSAITGDNVNNRTFNVYRRNGSGTQATIASLTTTTGIDFAAWISKSLGSLSNTALAADEVLTCEVTAAGGGAPTNVKGVFTVIVTYDR